MDIVTLGNWLAAIFIIFFFTILYKENIFFRLCESTLIAVSVGYALYQGIKSVQSGIIKPLMGGEVILLIPIILGLLMYMRFYKPFAFLIRYPLAVLIGVGTGLSIAGLVLANFVAQIRAVIFPSNMATGVLMAVITFSVISYFLFSFEQKGIYGQVTKLGRTVMMAAFGAIFATVLLTRYTLLTDRLQFLLRVFGLLK